MIIDTTQARVETQITHQQKQIDMVCAPCPDLEFSNTLISDLSELSSTADDLRFILHDILALACFDLEQKLINVDLSDEDLVRLHEYHRDVEKAWKQFNPRWYYRSCFNCSKRTKATVGSNGRKYVCIWCSSECQKVSGDGNYD